MTMTTIPQAQMDAITAAIRTGLDATGGDFSYYRIGRERYESEEAAQAEMVSRLGVESWDDVWTATAQVDDGEATYCYATEAECDADQDGAYADQYVHVTDGPEEGLEWGHAAFAEARRLTDEAGMSWDFEGWARTLDVIEQYNQLGGITADECE